MLELVAASDRIGDRDADGATCPGYTHLQRAQPVLLEPSPRAPTPSRCCVTSTVCFDARDAPQRLAARRRAPSRGRRCAIDPAVTAKRSGL